MLMERVAGCWWNDWPDVRGTRGRMAWNTHQTGSYLGEDDIVRYEDIYARA